MTYQQHDDVAVIQLDNPPVNGLNHELRQTIVAGLDRASEDQAVRAIVLQGSARAFSGGADVREFNTPKAAAEPTLATVTAAIESSEKPVIAAIAGVCMGGGLELALGCHRRVALASARLALPEVKLGLIPGAGGTQRLPRALGVERALNMIVTGETAAARTLADTGLLDEVVDDELLEAALGCARAAAADGVGGKRLRDRPVAFPNSEGFFAFARSQVAARAGAEPAPVKCVEAVAAAATLPFDEGLKQERRLFSELVQSPESKALRHIFFAERAAAKIPGVESSTPVRNIDSVAVIGAGTMGSGIAMSLLAAGIPVTLLEVQPEALERGVATIRKNLERRVSKGKLSAEELQANMDRLSPVMDYAALAEADLAIEAVYEDLEVKREVFEALDRVMKSGAILASNTSTLDVDRIAAFTRRPQDVVGLHFFSPANVMRLLEIVHGRETGADVLASAMQMARRIGKIGVVSGVCDGFIGNRMLEHYNRQAWFMLEEGALPQQIDKALESFGFAMGPFRVGDLAGNDIGWAIRKRRYVERPNFVYSKIADRLCEQGRFGQKTGAGWYRYEPGDRRPQPDPVVEQMIVAYSQELGVQRRKITDEEIIGRCVYALVNEGARILEEGIAQRASDIDMVWLNGYGFPRVRGGPMFYADTQGLFNAARRMRHFARIEHGDPEFWEPAPLLASLAESGDSFN